MKRILEIIKQRKKHHIKEFKEYNKKAKDITKQKYYSVPQLRQRELFYKKMYAEQSVVHELNFILGKLNGKSKHKLSN
jgi:hypothetical protein